MMDPNQIMKIIQKALPGCQVQVQDLTGTQDHYKVVIVAAEFQGISMLEQHRKVYEILDSCMEAKGGGIHALSLSTGTPDQYKTS